MALHPLAGQKAPRSLLVNVPRLVSAYYALKPDASDPAQRVAFGTSGHRGSSLKASFNEDHILATSQAIVEHRRAQRHRRAALPRHGHARALRAGARHGARGARGQRRRGPDPGGPPLHADAGDLARDPQLEPRPHDGARRRHRHHAVAQPAGRRRLQVQPARRRAGGHRHHEGGRGARERDPRGRPGRDPPLHARRRRCARPRRASTTSWRPTSRTSRASSTWRRSPGRSCGSASTRWAARRSTTGSRSPSATRLHLEVVNPVVDPTFSFMTLDKDGKIRMDCSSPYAMAGLIGLKDRFDVAFGNDADTDRHGIVTPSAGLLNPNHYLAGGDRVPVPPPARLAARRGGRQDARRRAR